MTLQKKVDKITRKIEDLKSQQHKIESGIALQLLEVIKSQSGFTLPFDAVVGGLLEVIEICKKDQVRSEAWQDVGEKFLKTRGKNNTRTPRNSKNLGQKNVDAQEIVPAKDIQKQLEKDIAHAATTIDKVG